jgi:type III secretory pathway component EscS
MLPKTKIKLMKEDKAMLVSIALAVVIGLMVSLVPLLTNNQPESVCVTAKLSLTKNEYMTICGVKS